MHYGRYPDYDENEVTTENQLFPEETSGLAEENATGEKGEVDEIDDYQRQIDLVAQKLGDGPFPKSEDEAICAMKEAFSNPMAYVRTRAKGVMRKLEENEYQAAREKAIDIKCKANNNHGPSLNEVKKVAEWKEKSDAYDKMKEIAEAVIEEWSTARHDLERETERADDAERRVEQLETRINSIPFLDT